MIIQLVPGDPARVALGVQATEEAVQARRERLGLNDPLLVQYANWVGNALQGDLGSSLITGQPVAPQIIQRLPTTLQLAFLSIIIGMLVGFPLGIISALKPGSAVDTIASIISQLGVAIPDFWMGILLVLLFSTTLDVLPPSGYTSITEDAGDWLEHMILPAITAGLISGAIQTRFIRSAMLEVLGQNYIKTARAKGLPERTVLIRHALRNAMITIVTIIGLQVTALLSAVVVIEIVFVLPGLGKLALDAVLDRDYPVLQGTVLTIAVLVTLINLGVDLLYFLLDPRIEYA
jgi:peptide/nickel transport system permease protein